MRALSSAHLLATLTLLAASLDPSDAAACALSGRARVEKGTLLRAPGGEVIARFSGTSLSLSLTLDAVGARASTGDGFRVDGLLDLAGVSIFTRRNLPVVVDHVWIAGGRRVAARLDAGAITVEQRVGAPIGQTLRAKAPCDALSLEPVSFTHPPVPDAARGWVPKRAPLTLRDAGGAEVFTLTSDGIKDALLFFSTERRGGSVHVVLRGDVVVDAWASAGELQALAPGELLGAASSEVTIPSAPRLAFDGAVRRVKAAREATIRSKPDDSAPSIGAVAPDTEVLVLETVLGWSSVWPASLAIQPPEGRGFWVKQRQLDGK